VIAPFRKYQKAHKACPHRSTIVLYVAVSQQCGSFVQNAAHERLIGQPVCTLFISLPVT
jgi:hypothetical protein